MMANQNPFFLDPNDPSASSDAYQVNRKRAIAQMLQQQALRPIDADLPQNMPIMPRVGIGHGLTKLAQALMARNAMQDADQAQTDYSESQKRSLVDGLKNYQNLMQGTPERTVANDASGDEMVTMPAQPGNPQAAYMSLIESNNPMLQQMGLQQLTQKPGKYSVTPQYDQNGRAFLVNESGGIKYLDGVQARDKMEIAPSGVAYNPYQLQQGQVFNDPNKIMAIGPDGSPVVNQPLVDAKKGIAKAGATNVQVKNDVKTGESLAGQVGPIMKESAATADAAVKQVDAAQRIINAVDSGSIIAGPGASTRLKLTQIGETLGVGGKDAAEKIENTRQAIRGLAELTLQGRQQMRGQGAITESESRLAERAVSGDIDELTPAEIRILAQASERAARFNYAEHQRRLEAMQTNPNLEGIVPFYQGPQMPAEVKNQPQQKNVRRFNPATGRIE